VKILELFSGQGSISAAFKQQGHEAYRVDWSTKIDAELHADVNELTADRLIELCQGVPDVIWASPECTTYSIATHRHRTLKEALAPKTDKARYDDQVNLSLWALIDELMARGTRYYFVENPRGRMRHMNFVQGRPRFTVSYCSYGRKANAKGYEEFYINKPTDIWTNHPKPAFKALCSKDNKTHIHGRSKSADKRDYLSRGEIPKDLINHIVTICEDK
jgi:site-specific DNA-cytosine methylase